MTTDAIRIAEAAAGKLHTYRAYYRGRQITVQAETTFAAQQAAAVKFKARKSYEVSIVLDEAYDATCVTL